MAGTADVRRKIGEGVGLDGVDERSCKRPRSAGSGGSSRWAASIRRSSRTTDTSPRAPAGRASLPRDRPGDPELHRRLVRGDDVTHVAPFAVEAAVRAGPQGVSSPGCSAITSPRHWHAPRTMQPSSPCVAVSESGTLYSRSPSPRGRRSRRCPSARSRPNRPSTSSSRGCAR